MIWWPVMNYADGWVEGRVLWTWAITAALAIVGIVWMVVTAEETGKETQND